MAQILLDRAMGAGNLVEYFTPRTASLWGVFKPITKALRHVTMKRITCTIEGVETCIKMEGRAVVILVKIMHLWVLYCILNAYKRLLGTGVREMVKTDCVQEGGRLNIRVCLIKY